MKDSLITFAEKFSHNLTDDDWYQLQSRRLKNNGGPYNHLTVAGYCLALVGHGGDFQLTERGQALLKYARELLDECDPYGKTVLKSCLHGLLLQSEPDWIPKLEAKKLVQIVQEHGEKYGKATPLGKAALRSDKPSYLIVRSEGQSERHQR